MGEYVTRERMNRSDASLLPATEHPSIDMGRVVDEYKECNQNLRHYGSMRFAELTLFFAINTALLGAVLRKPDGLVRYEEIGATVAGAFFAVLFATMNRRRVALWNALYRRAVALETQLGFSQHTTRPPAGLLSNRNAATALYLFFVVVWIAEFFLRMRGAK